MKRSAKKKIKEQNKLHILLFILLSAVVILVVVLEILNNGTFGDTRSQAFSKQRYKYYSKPRCGYMDPTTDVCKGQKMNVPVGPNLNTTCSMLKGTKDSRGGYICISKTTVPSSETNSGKVTAKVSIPDASKKIVNFNYGYTNTGNIAFTGMDVEFNYNCERGYKYLYSTTFSKVDVKPDMNELINLYTLPLNEYCSVQLVVTVRNNNTVVGKNSDSKTIYFPKRVIK